MSEKSHGDSQTQAKEPTTFLDSNWTWSEFSSWPLSIKFFPALIPIVGIWIAILSPNLVQNVSLDRFAQDPCLSNFNYTFQIARTKHHAETLATHDWEIGTVAEAVLELISPEKAIFGANPFPGGRIPSSWFKLDEALSYVYTNIHIDGGGQTLYHDNFSVSDPASLGVAAVMLGQHWSRSGWYEAAGRQEDYLLNDALRYSNGAISHRVEVAELWSDAVFMVPPFLAYYAVASNYIELMREAVRQCELYRDVLLMREGERKGLWSHIVGPSGMADDGAWSTGNAWAAYGMARVRATIASWSTSKNVLQNEIRALDSYITEILEGAMRTDDHPSDLLRNYLGDDTWFGETSGTTFIAATAYRMAMFIEPSDPAREKILVWADQKRKAVTANVDEDGIARPAVNPLKHDQREPLEGPSPEGEAFLLLMGAAWRDCVCANVCSLDT